MNIFVIADTHFGSEMIMKCVDRPFDSVQVMNQVMIDNWNSVVGKDDLVLHLGDVCENMTPEELTKIMQQLNGRKLLVKGNHDMWTDNVYRRCGFDYVSAYPMVFRNFYLLSHEPLLLSTRLPFASLYGHVHNDERYTDTSNSMCCCVERLNYTPKLLMEA